MSSPLGGYVGNRPAWSFRDLQGVFDINDRFAEEQTIAKTVTVAPGATAVDSIEMSDPCLIRSVRLNKQAWFRLYDSDISRSNDTLRLVTTDPIAAVGVQLEIRTSGDQRIDTSPAPAVTNRQSTPGPYPFRLTNESPSADVTVEIKYIPLIAY